MDFLAKAITTTHTDTITTITPKTIVVFLPTFDLEVNIPIQTNGFVQNIRIPAVEGLAIVQIAFKDGDIVTIAITFVPQQGIYKGDRMVDK